MAMFGGKEMTTEGKKEGRGMKTGNGERGT